MYKQFVYLIFYMGTFLNSYEVNCMSNLYTYPKLHNNDGFEFI